MRFLTLAALVLEAGLAFPQADADGFVPLFNGKDLSGWVNVNGAPETWSVQDGMVVTTGKPMGVLRSPRMYENYILELDWRHVHEGGNSGLFVHSGALPECGHCFTKAFEIQIMLGDDPKGLWTRHGDVFAIQGASFVPDRPHPAKWMRCLPSENRVRGAGEWNHYRVTSRDGSIKLEVNGREVSGGTECRPRKGYLCLESEGSECHFRNLRIRELPPSLPPGEEVAPPDEGWKALYTGDLRGWRKDAANEGHWVPADWILRYDAKGHDLWTEKEYVNFILVADWRFPGPPVEKEAPIILPDGSLSGEKMKVQDAGDSGIFLRGSQKSQVNIWCWPVGSGEIYGYRTDMNLGKEVRAGATPKVCADHAPGEWNRFVITLKGDRLTVVLNGKTVIDQAHLPGIPARGPIGLQHPGGPLTPNMPVDFANFFIKELP
jgi:hypothetical protein